MENNTAPTSEDNTRNAWLVGAIIGFALLFLIFVLLYLLGCLWPNRLPAKAGNPATIDPIAYFPMFGSLSLPDELRYLWLVAVAAALGSYIHAATSFATFVGNRKLATSWLWWYVLRAPIGVSLGLVFYFAFRGGLLTASASGADINPFGICAIGALTGMFSKQATDKLRETFDTLFRTAPGKGDDVREDKLEPAVPVITAADPPQLVAGQAQTAITLTGKNFVAGVIGHVNGAQRETTVQSESKLALTLLADDTAKPGTIEITISTPAGAESAAFSLPVTEASQG